MSTILRVADLGKSFATTPALQGQNFAIERGERLAVLGRSGSGKTTLLRLIAGLETPTSGEIAIDGRVASRAGSILLPPERRGVAMVFQGLALFPHLRALDQVAFASPGRGGLETARNLLDRVGLGHRAGARLDELSGGERQRIALARAMAQGPQLLLMDEPFASLDDERRAELRDLLLSLLHASGITLILVTHSREDAFALARRAIVISDGHAKADDDLHSLAMRPRHAAVVKALGLGELLPGVVSSGGIADTAFGKVQISGAPDAGPVRILVRHDQPQLDAGGCGVEAEVRAIEQRPQEQERWRRVAVLRAGGQTIRMFLERDGLAVGARVPIRIVGKSQVVSDS